MAVKIALDTNVFIYALEDLGQLGDTSRDILHKIAKSRQKVVTSVLTVEEILVGVYLWEWVNPRPGGDRNDSNNGGKTEGRI